MFQDNDELSFIELFCVLTEGEVGRLDAVVDDRNEVRTGMGLQLGQGDKRLQMIFLDLKQAVDLLLFILMRAFRGIVPELFHKIIEDECLEG